MTLVCINPREYDVNRLESPCSPLPPHHDNLRVIEIAMEKQKPRQVRGYSLPSPSQFLAGAEEPEPLTYGFGVSHVLIS